jgi:hypothetical protein
METRQSEGTNPNEAIKSEEGSRDHLAQKGIQAQRFVSQEEVRRVVSFG